MGQTGEQAARRGRPSTDRTQTVEVVVEGGLDAAAAARLRSLLEDALALRPRHLLVDLARCPFIQAAAVEVLLDAHRRAWHADTRFSLRGPSERLRRTLRLARVDHVLDILAPSPSPSPAGRSGGGTW